MATPIVTDGTTERVGHAPRVVLPSGAQLFVERAARFGYLANGHPLGAYLQLMARVSDLQARALTARAAAAVTEAARAASRAYGMPPLSAQSHARDPLWRADLAAIAAGLRGSGGTELDTTLDRLDALTPDALESLADRVLAGDAQEADAALVPLAGAALQVYFTRLAATLPVADVGNCDVATICPVCATRPVASVVRIGGAQANLRYLVCALCNTEWNMVRVKCTACEQEKGVGYLSVERQGGGEAPVRAETCDECKSYLKILYQEKDPNLDPVADDLATLSLDLLVDEQGYRRSGPNFLLYPGSGQ